METNMRHSIRKTAALCALLVGLSACADLDVVNPNDPDRGRALASPGDVESLIAGSFGSWWLTASSHLGKNPIMANQSFMWSAFPANFGMFRFSVMPRIAVANSPTDEFYPHLDYTWSRNYRALSAAAQGLAAIATPEVRSGFVLADGRPDLERLRRMEAYARFVQGLALGSLALHYEHVFYVDEHTNTDELQETISYSEAMDRALGFFGDAIDIASAGPFPAIPDTWMSVTVTRDELIRLAHSMRARYRANVARTESERINEVDWAAVIADVDAGITETWYMEVGAGNFFHNMSLYMGQHPVGWQQMSYFLMGMADQSGRYQEWIALPHAEKVPRLPSSAMPNACPTDDGFCVLLITPDLRFPQGETLAEQIANPGLLHIEEEIAERGGRYHVIGPRDWRNPERGTHRWSYYRAQHMQYYVTRPPGSVPAPEVTMAEMRLLKAEGLIRTGNPGAAADLINVTRTRAGLNATDAAGTNTSCVPRLWTGECGDLFEMLKWEKRIETHTWGVHSNTWFFDGRGWGDLYAGTPTTHPVPCLDRELLIQPCDTFGGQPGQPGSAPISNYAFPHES
jgi:hypothetical protein